jgi:hypothetical protein
MGINDSYGYAEQLQANASAHKGSGLKGDALLGMGVVGFTHWRGNRRRKKMGLPQEPLSRSLRIGMGLGLGWVFWWVPFVVYMLLDVVFLHLHILSFGATVLLFAGAFILYKRHHAKKYAAYYAAKAQQPAKPVNLHAPGSSDWLAETGNRVRNNLSGH